MELLFVDILRDGGTLVVEWAEGSLTWKLWLRVDYHSDELRHEALFVEHEPFGARPRDGSRVPVDAFPQWLRIVRTLADAALQPRDERLLRRVESGILDLAHSVHATDDVSDDHGRPDESDAL